MKSYTDLLRFPTFSERYNFLKLPGEVGIQTFGFERYINQSFYTSKEWRRARQEVIFRDDGCDLALADRPIYGYVRVHHINPVSVEDFEKENFTKLLDPEYLVCVSLDTHNAIHFGTEPKPKIPLIERKPFDQKMW